MIGPTGARVGSGRVVRGHPSMRPRPSIARGPYRVTPAGALPHRRGLDRTTELAKRENRTMSELVREALRKYERKSWWTEMNAFGQAKAQERGLTEQP